MSELRLWQMTLLRFFIKLVKVTIIAMYCHLRPPDTIAFPT